MRLVVDLALQDLLRTRHGNRRYLAAQLFARTVDLLLYLRFCSTKLAIALFDAVGLAFGNDLIRTGVCLIKYPGRLPTGNTKDLDRRSFFR